MMLSMQTNTKADNGLIHIKMQKKIKDANILKMPFYFCKDQIFVFETEDSACPWGREVILIRHKMVVRTKPFYGQNYEQDAIKVRNIPSCVLSSGRPRVARLYLQVSG